MERTERLVMGPPTVRGAGLLQRLDGLVATGVATLLTAGAAALAIIVFAQVVSRYVFNAPFTWSEELARYLLVWVVFLGVTLGIRSGAHFGVKFIIERAPDFALPWLAAIRDGSILLFFALVMVEGVTAIGLNVGERSAALHLQMSYVYAVFPISGAIAILHTVAALLRGPAPFRSVFAAIVIAVLLGASLVFVSLPGSWALAIFLAASLILLGAGTPVAVAIGLAAVLAIGWAQISPLEITVERLFSAVNNFTLMAVPFFMLTGTFLNVGGLAERIIDFATLLVGRLRGGLAMVDVVASMLFADISGSSTSDTAAIGSTMIPGLAKKGYDEGFACALQASSGSMGMLVPPSICTIVFSTVAGVSVATMFMSSILPALLMAASFMAIAYLYARKHRLPATPRLSSPEIRRILRRSSLPIITPLIILVGLFAGVFTPTEAGVVALAYTIVIGTVSRGLTPSRAKRATLEGTQNFSMIFLIIGTATILSWLLTHERIPQLVATALPAISHNPIVILALLMVILAILHTMLETVATILIVTPIVLPVLVQMGVDPLHFGVLLMMNSSIGLILPPIGLCLYISCAIGRVPIERATRAVLPFVGAIACDLALLILFPQIILIVPRLFGAL